MSAAPAACGQLVERLDHRRAQGLVELLDRLAAVLLVAQEPVACGVRHPGEEDRSARGLDHPALGLVADDDVGHIERAEDVDGGGLLCRAGQVVVADEQQGGHAVGQAFDAPGELALLGGFGVARLEGVAGEDDQVGVVRERVVDNLIQPIEEIAHAAGGAGGGIELAVVFHADVQVGEMHEADGGRHGGILTGRIETPKRHMIDMGKLRSPVTG